MENQTSLKRSLETLVPKVRRNFEKTRQLGIVLKQHELNIVSLTTSGVGEVNFTLISRLRSKSTKVGTFTYIEYGSKWPRYASDGSRGGRICSSDRSIHVDQ
jgi:hypothetical protein